MENRYDDDELVEFIKANHCNQLRYRIEEHETLNWVEANRKLMNAKELKAKRLVKLKELLAIAEKYKRRNH